MCKVCPTALKWMIQFFTQFNLLAWPVQCAVLGGATRNSSSGCPGRIRSLLAPALIRSGCSSQQRCSTVNMVRY